VIEALLTDSEAKKVVEKVVNINPNLVRDLKNIDLWVDQVLFWRTHLDVFITDYLKCKLYDTQHIVARQIGNGTDTYVVKSRGYGKTWLVTLCAIALCILYPDTSVAIVSASVRQANLCMKKINRYFSKNPEIMREILITSKNGNPAQINKNGGICNFKNGSSIESAAIASMRGERTKIIIVDEAPEVGEDELKRVVGPTKNYKREICHKLGIDDYESKTISITSACLKNRYFYSIFMNALKLRAQGDKTYFACALDYRSQVRLGMTPLSYFEKERKNMSQVEFDMEYGSYFIGEEANSAFPYSLVEPCRLLGSVETIMPKDTKCSYIISVDIATSMEKTADNAVISVIKLIELENGGYIKRLVLMRTYHGTKLDGLAEEVRKLYLRFPKTIKVVFDHRGLGDSFPQFLDKPWVDPLTGKEFPAWVIDGEPTLIKDAEPMLYAIVASNELNRKMASSLRVALEQHTLELPVNSRGLYIESGFEERPYVEPEAKSEEEDDVDPTQRTYSRDEYAVFRETDALQMELGSIIAKTTDAGNVVYTTAQTNQHKDRYTSLAMGVYYISELETKRKNEILRGKDVCFGIFSAMG
jgi:hypothetical protein